MSSVEPVERLPTDKVRPFIDLVNVLQSVGLEQDVALPSIAVIGDRNSGKSSVLEALCGVTLPRERIYTLVLQMNKTRGEEWNGIVKNLRPRLPYTSAKEKRIDPHDHKSVPGLLQYCLGYDLMVGSSDLIGLEISSPDVPDLTLIDLPSIPSVADSYVEEIKQQIKKFITNPECIILMVVPCDVDITTTQAFKMAREVDPDGERTLGLLTKPDIVDQVKEKTIVDTVQNKVIKLKKGFMIVRCYDQMCLMDPSDKEVKFFKEHALFKSFYDGGYATFPKLAERLSQELAQHIEKYLPQLKEYVKKEQLKANAAIKRFGKTPPSAKADKLTFLADKINTFIQDIMRLTTGELLDLTDQKVFRAWRKMVKDSEESLQCIIAAEVGLREQSGFSDFQTFDHLIKEHIRLLEEPAIRTLNSSAGIVKKELLKVMESAFYGFPNLISEATSANSNVISSNQRAAEFLLRAQFKMEEFEVLAEGRLCTNKKREKKKGPIAQLNSYYQTICQRLTSQIQMIIHLHMFKESSIELQKKMLQLLDDKNVAKVLKYDHELTRENILKTIIPLTNAQIMLSEM